MSLALPANGRQRPSTARQEKSIRRANISLDAFLIDLDLLYEPEGGHFFGKLAGLYRFALDPLCLAVGGGLFTDTSHEDVLFFLEGSAGLELGKNFDLYGTADYALSSGELTFKVGTSFGF